MIPHPESASPRMLEILHFLNGMGELKQAALGGGTSLALRFGHRKSIDLDFFMVEPFDSPGLQETLIRLFPDLEILNRTSGSLCAITESIKLDFLLHSYPLLREYSSLDALRCLSLPDLAAMKVNAVTNRGSKKDFSDLLLLHENGIPLTAALDFFSAKYGQAGRFLAIRSLNWFADAEEEPDPLYLNGWTWPEVHQRMAGLAKALLK